MHFSRVTILLILIVGLTSISATCDKGSSPDDSDTDRLFRIYVTTEPAGSEMPPMNEMQLNEEPFLTTSDITRYEWGTHTIHFSTSVHDRLIDWGNLNLRTFVVTVMGNRVYWGKFMCGLNSQICQNPVVNLELSDNAYAAPQPLVIERAYPEYYGSPDDPDIRDNPSVYNALQQAGILDD